MKTHLLLVATCATTSWSFVYGLVPLSAGRSWNTGGAAAFAGSRSSTKYLSSNHRGVIKTVVWMSSSPDEQEMPYSPPPPPKASPASPVKSSMDDELPLFSMDVITDTLSSIKLDAIGDTITSALANVQEGEFGSRGEEYVAAQAFLILCIIGGGVPVIGTPLSVLFGPVLVLAGLAVAFLGVTEIGDGLSPFPATTSNTELKTTGVYSYVRHPLYSSLLSTLLGIGVATDSATRVILVGVLFYVLNLKVGYEERELKEKFPEYEAYMEEVPGKFVPDIVTSKISSVFKK